MMQLREMVYGWKGLYRFLSVLMWVVYTGVHDTNTLDICYELYNESLRTLTLEVCRILGRLMDRSLIFSAPPDQLLLSNFMSIVLDGLEDHKWRTRQLWRL